MRPSIPLSLALLCTAACAPSLQSAAIGDDPVAVGVLDNCAEERPESFVRSFHCEGLTAVDTVLLSARPRDVSVAFDSFATIFAGRDPKRVDSVYTAGETRQTWMRLQGKSASGAPLEAQMVAVQQGEGLRLVTCSAQGDERCGAVMASLLTDDPAETRSP